MERLLNATIKSEKKAAAIIASIAAAAYCISLALGIFTDDAVNFLNASRCGWSYSELASCFKIKVGMSHDGIVPEALAGDVKYYRPLTMLSFRADTILFGNSFGLYHLQNILLSVANAVLVFFLGMFILKKKHGDTAPAIRTAFLGGVLFALCPINFFTVFWLSSRTDLLCSFFFALSLLSCFASLDRRAPVFATPSNAFSGRFYLALSLVLFALSLLAKEASIATPALIFIFGVLHRKKAADEKLKASAISHSALDATLYLIVAAVYFVVRNATLGGLSLPSGVSFYMFPIGDPLFFYFAIQKIAHSFLALAFFAPPVPIKMLFYKPLYNIIAVAAITFAAWSAVRLSRPLWPRGEFRALACAYFVCFLPTLPFLPAPHYFYVPSIFFCLAAALFLIDYQNAGRKLLYMRAYLGAAAITVAALFAIMLPAASYNAKLCAFLENRIKVYENSDYFKKTGLPPEFFIFDATLLSPVALPEFKLRTRDAHNFLGFLINRATRPYMPDSKIVFMPDGSLTVSASDEPFFSGILDEFIYSSKIDIAAGTKMACDYYEIEAAKTRINTATGNTGISELVLRFGPKSCEPGRRIYISANHPEPRELK